MKKLIFLLALIMLTLQGGCQNVDQTFEKIILVKKGIMFGDGSIQTTAATGTGIVTWDGVSGKPVFSTIALSGSYNDLLNRPTLFDGTWTSLTGKPTTFTPAVHNHNTLYRPITYVPTWTEITSKPDTVTLETAVTSMAFVMQQMTTTQINAIQNPKEGRIVYDITLHVVKYWNGTVWKIMITGN